MSKFQPGDLAQALVNGEYAFRQPLPISSITKHTDGTFYYFFDGIKTGYPESSIEGVNMGNNGTSPNGTLTQEEIELAAKEFDKHGVKTDESTTFEIDALGFNIFDKEINDIPNDVVLGKYRNIKGSSDENLLTHKIWIKRLKLNTLVRNFPQIVHKISMLENKLASYCELDMHDMALELLITGMYQKVKELNSLKAGTDDKLLREIMREVNALRELEQISKEKNAIDTLMPIFQKYGREGFEDWCEDNDWNAQEFYRLHKESMSKMSWSKRAKEWIRFNVESLDDPMPIDDFKQKAKDEGIIDEYETNWQAFYRHIGRLGYLNHPYGHVFNGD